MLAIEADTSIPVPPEGRNDFAGDDLSPQSC